MSFHEAVVLGYFSKREDFEVEYENEAELMVSQLDDDYPTSNSAILTEDDELVKTLNVVHVDMYKAKLRERERRKKVSRDHSLICKPILIFQHTLSTGIISV